MLQPVSIFSLRVKRAVVLSFESWVLQTLATWVR